MDSIFLKKLLSQHRIVKNVKKWSKNCKKFCQKLSHKFSCHFYDIIVIVKLGIYYDDESWWLTYFLQKTQKFSKIFKKITKIYKKMTKMRNFTNAFYIMGNEIQIWPKNTKNDEKTRNENFFGVIVIMFHFWCDFYLIKPFIKAFYFLEQNCKNTKNLWKIVKNFWKKW